ncbi:MAG: BatD family protein, partial [Myxococcota bacterium]|jgi:hypothetical protein
MKAGTDFKAFDPTITDDLGTGQFRFSGERKWEYLLIPLRAGKLEIPPVEFDYFDPVAGKYEKIASEAFRIDVAPGGAVMAGSGGSVRDEGPATPGGMRPIRYSSELKTYNPRWYGAWWLKVLFVIFPAAWLGYSLFDRIRSFERRETPYARQKRAYAQVQKRLKAASAMLKAGAGDRAAFYSELSRVITGYVSYMLRTECSGMTIDAIGRAMTEAGVDPSLSERVAGELEACDFARFAPASSDEAGMKAAIERVRTLLVDLEKKR